MSKNKASITQLIVKACQIAITDLADWILASV